jgi:hypothetical protein
MKVGIRTDSHLLQHPEPSSGCAQHAPLLSDFVSLGVQQTERSFFGVQQLDVATSVFTLVIFDF